MPGGTKVLHRQGGSGYTFIKEDLIPFSRQERDSGGTRGEEQLATVKKHRNKGVNGRKEPKNTPLKQDPKRMRRPSSHYVRGSKEPREG